jgi:serine/threonine protein kinase
MQSFAVLHSGTRGNPPHPHPRSPLTEHSDEELRFQRTMMNSLGRDSFSPPQLLLHRGCSRRAEVMLQQKREKVQLAGGDDCFHTPPETGFTDGGDRYPSAAADGALSPTPLHAMLMLTECQLVSMKHEDLIKLFRSLQKAVLQNLRLSPLTGASRLPNFFSSGEDDHEGAINTITDPQEGAGRELSSRGKRRSRCPSRTAVEARVASALACPLSSRHSSFRTTFTCSPELSRDVTPLPPSGSSDPKHDDQPNLLSARVGAQDPHSSDDSTRSRTVIHRPRSTHHLVKDLISGTATKMLNQYEVLGDLGKGSCGKVKLGYDSVQNMPVAIKIVKKPSGFGTGRSHAQQGALLREIAIMKKLRHQNIVSLLEVINDPSCHKIYIVMEYVDHGALAKILDDLRCEPIDPTRLMSYARQITAGLAYLHKNNIVHRDIKPENILVSEDQRVFIADFGVSQLLGNEHRASVVELFACNHPLSQSHEEADEDEDTTTSATRRGQRQIKSAATPESPRLLKGAKGTVLFMSPELLASGESDDGFAVDMWALGITFWTLLSGQMPFGSSSEIQRLTARTDAVFSRDAMQRLMTKLDGDRFQDSWIYLLQGMLEVDVQKRMTAREAHRAIKVSLAMCEDDSFSQSLRFDENDIDKALTAVAPVPPEAGVLFQDNSMADCFSCQTEGLTEAQGSHEPSRFSRSDLSTGIFRQSVSDPPRAFDPPVDHDDTNQSEAGAATDKSAKVAVPLLDQGAAQHSTPRTTLFAAGPHPLPSGAVLPHLRRQSPQLRDLSLSPTGALHGPAPKFEMPHFSESSTSPLPLLSLAPLIGTAATREEAPFGADQHPTPPPSSPLVMSPRLLAPSPSSIAADESQVPNLTGCCRCCGLHTQTTGTDDNPSHARFHRARTPETLVSAQDFNPLPPAANLEAAGSARQTTKRSLAVVPSRCRLSTISPAMSRSRSTMLPATQEILGRRNLLGVPGAFASSDTVVRDVSYG